MPYFDNAATTQQKPRAVLDAVYHAMERFGNPSRSAHKPALEAAHTIFAAREELAGFLGCTSPERVIFTKNATEALNIAIQSIQGPIVTSEAEHNSVLRPVFRTKDPIIVPANAQGCISPAAILSACREDVAAVVLTHASNLTGNVNDLATIGQYCREHRLLFIVDAAQTAGLLPIDMEALNADALCFTGHKSLYGPQGTGGLCLSERYLPSPVLTGGSGSQSFSPLHPDFLPDRLEAGTLNGHGIAGLLAAVRYLKEQGSQPFRKANRLARLFYDLTKNIPGIVFYGDYTAPCRVPVVSLNLPGYASAELSAELSDRYDMATRSGVHCAPLLHRCFGTEQRGAVRFSFSHFNTEDEIHLAASALKTLAAETQG